MHLVEKIGNLILVTFEDELTYRDIEEIKAELKKIAEVSLDDVVVSFNFSQRRTQGLSFTLEQKINELLKFCHLSGLRVYSYRFE
jgi:collagenase-like PrtC family protease